jgi:hypothetical protein
MAIGARGWALLLVVLAGCPTRTRRVGVVSGPPEAPSVTVAPLSAADLALDPTRGLVLGAGGAGRARPVALLGRPHWIEVGASGTGGDAGWSTFWLMARPRDRRSGNPILPPPELPPNPDAPPPARPPSGPPLTDPWWPSALWETRLIATGAVGKGPLDIDLSALSRGRELELPPAGTLATAAIAALTGARLPRSAVVIAELDPDGSLLPAADPLAAVRDALSHGARRLVLPVGGRVAPAPTPPGQPAATVDLVRIIRTAGGRVWIAPDLAGAYRALTGAPLPEPEPATDADLALTRGERAALDAAYRRALERVAAGWPRLVEQQNRGRLAGPLAALLAGAERGARRAERLRALGDGVAAYARLTEAAALLDAAVRLDQILRLVAEGDLAQARVELDGARVPTDAALLAAPTAVPSTIADHLREADLYALSAGRWAWTEEAAARVRPARAALDAAARIDRSRLGTPAAARELAEGVAPLLVAGARARALAERAQDRGALEPAAARGQAFAIDRAALRQIAAGDGGAARTALAALDQALAAAPATGPGPGSPIVAASPTAPAAPAARPRPRDLVTAERLLSLLDDGDLARAPGRPRVAQDRAPLLALAIARRVHDDAAGALGRARRLAPSIDPWTGQVISLGKPGRLPGALALAERAARQRAAAARVAVGAVPLSSRLAFQAAVGLARGDRAEKLLALELFHEASAGCRLALLLALSEAAAAPTSATGVAAAHGGCPPSPSARPPCR